MKFFLWGTVSVLLARAVYTDIKRNQIENRLMVVGMTVALICAWIRGSAGGLIESLKMVGIVFAVLIFLFIVRGLGAGDIKLLCVLAAFFPHRIIGILVSSFFAAAIIALGRITVRGVKKQPLYHSRETIHFTIPVTVGTVFTLVWG